MVGLSRVLVALGAIALFGGLIAGIVNREILDGDSFAAHADRVRTDTRVAAQLGDRIADELIAADPNLVAVRPLLQATAADVVASSEFGPAFRVAVVPIHDVFTTRDSGQLFLVNHWLNRPETRATDAKEANSAKVLGDQLRQCERQRGMMPNCDGDRSDRLTAPAFDT